MLTTLLEHCRENIPDSHRNGALDADIDSYVVACARLQLIVDGAKESGRGVEVDGFDLLVGRGVELASRCAGAYWLVGAAILNYLAALGSMVVASDG